MVGEVCLPPQPDVCGGGLGCCNRLFELNALQIPDFITQAARLAGEARRDEGLWGRWIVQGVDAW